MKWINNIYSQKLYDVKHSLFKEVDGYSLAIFRILIGLLISKDVLNQYLSIEYHLHSIPSDFRQSYYGFEWVQPEITLIAISSFILPISVFCIILGLFYRLMMPITTLIITYFFLLFPEHYLNHYYMLLLFCTLMCFLPANAVWSCDFLLKKHIKKLPLIWGNVREWNYWILRLQTEIILVYAGLVKINPDWLRLQPLATWLRADMHNVPIIGGFFYYDTTIALGAYGIILLHTIGAPLLVWNTTRPWIVLLYCCFHLTNSQIFDIGMFPFLTIGATLLFFSPSWPRDLLVKCIPLKQNTNKISSNNRCSLNTVDQNVIIFAMILWLSIQIAIPLPALFSSNLVTAWTGYNDLFSWRMMLNQRSIQVAIFAVYIPEKKTIEFIPMRKFLSERQCTRTPMKPNLTIQYAHYLKDNFSIKYKTSNVEVHAYIMMAVNYREPELWANPKVNLAEYKAIYGIHEWLEPVDNPLRTWQEVIYAPKFNAPTYSQIRESMGLSKVENIIFNEHGITLQTPVANYKCRQRIPD